MNTSTYERETKNSLLTRKKRSCMEISVDILRVALDSAKKSHIVYKANLNFQIVNGFLNTLKTSGLLIGPSEDRIYQTTPKGIDFIEHFNDLETFLK
jgi:predicted transcriptional regulator